MTPTIQETNYWQKLKNDLQIAQDAKKQVAVQIRLLYDPATPQEPEGIEVCYQIDDQSYTRTFRGMPEGFDVAIQAE